MRLIYVTTRMNAEWQQWREKDPFRAAKLGAELDDFIGGAFVTVGDGKEGDGFLKRLHPHDDEIWEIRSMQPKPSLRIFCSFAEPDVLIATHMVLRTELGGFGSEAFGEARLTSQSEWRKCMSTWPPHRGEKLHDYITRNAGFVGNGW